MHGINLICEYISMKPNGVQYFVNQIASTTKNEINQICAMTRLGQQ